ncbi:MAG TPA: DUF4350 domain-containing protein, partial [Planctomycetaceae bacterium]|nr:DUF4350 domain-containing protein [Planctomycetaceae bacterium]
MLTTRNVVTVVILVMLISIVSAAISLLRSPSGVVTGRDSYGTQSYGFRGLYDTLEELNVPVERELTPPDGLLDRDITLAIFEPDPMLLTMEPAYLHTVGKWVENGGTVVVAPPVATPSRMMWGLQDWPPKTALEELSLTDVDTEISHASNEETPDEDEAETKSEAAEGGTQAPPRAKPKQKPRKSSGRSTFRSPNDVLDFALGKKLDIPVSIVHATVDGEFATRFPQGLQLAVPAKGPRVIRELKKIPGSHVRAVLEPGGPSQILAAIYPHGRGKIAVLSDARLAQNALLGRDDNAVLVANLLADPRRPVVFDEFYHGRTVR